MIDFNRAKKEWLKGRELFGMDNFTKYNEFKVSDHRNSFELKRIADSLENIERLLRDGKN